ncbi:hypothetical protein DFQ01_10372 [Paenibacillus cellulosilyticus]|uniref:Lipoprotein n=1 Tax=Paenibacillus cellulosilyticus TaxID=375489 RepID=A0A2V2YY33_9BACL|nr:hypothetical protein [Paenibacillus cellulosilyticus]PWW06171.1 hypothetical protein DFQ01_10372 [Paenibacillus cellulosilyticus]QKS43062.1 hypothetical protein HUB94_00815 [Paenibacillus cellulosilyticus]
MIKRKWYLRSKRWLLTVFGAAVFGIFGCGSMTDNMAADQFLALSISGLAGVDQFTFAGESGVLLPVGVTIGSLSYKGEVTGHSEMKVQMTGSGDNSGGKSGIGLQSMNGQWKLLAQRGADRWLPSGRQDGVRQLSTQDAGTSNVTNDGQSNGLWAGLNPLEKLERVRDAAKSVTYQENAAVRSGQRVIVIEMQPSAAKEEWTKRLEQQWSALMESGQQEEASGQAKQIQQAKQQLTAMLSTLSAETRYEVTADKRSMLPLRVVEHSTLHFQADGKDREESYTGEVTFDEF